LDERVLRALKNERAAAALVASVIQLSSLLPSNGINRNQFSALVKSAPAPPPQQVAAARSCESVLVRELLFVFQGLDGDILRFDAASRHFVLTPPADDVRFADLSDSVRALTMRLCEVGRSFRRVELFLRRVDSSAGTGVVLQALAAGVRDELTAFKRAVAALEPRRKSLTLRRLYAWSLGAAERLRWLAALVGGVKEARGGALLRLVAQFAAHGDADVRALVQSLVEQMSRPLRVMTRSWVLRGTVTDWHDEFFVYDRFVREPAATLDVSDGGDARSLWADRFQLADEMLPPTELLSADDARLALLLGKSINYLQSACDDHDVIATVAAATRSDGGDELDLHATVSAAADVVNRRLLDAMFVRHRLAAHVSAVRDFLTLSQGDFSAALLDALRDELQLPAVSLARHRLIDALDSAVRVSQVSTLYDARLLSRVDIRLLPTETLANGGDGAIGWDVLVLDYRVDAPLDAVLSPLCMRVYRRLFRWLLRVRRVSAALGGACWARQMQVRRRERVHPTHHALQLLRGDMARFVECIVQYVYATAIDEAWRAWLSESRRAAHLDGVIAAHERYLQTLLTSLLLAPDCAAMRRALEQLFRVCVLFAALHERMCGEARRGIEPTALDASRIASFRKQFNKQLGELMALLVDDNATARLSPQLRDVLLALANKLDFSEFYVRQAQDALLNDLNF
jgi:gamma-tubulin complex component 3